MASGVDNHDVRRFGPGCPKAEVGFGATRCPGLGELGVNWVIKQIVASPRPDSALLEVREELTSYGFPSGHVLFAVVCFGALAILLPGVGGRYAGLRKAAQAGLMLLAAAIATSRVYLGVHWPSDALGALAIGGVYLAVLVWSRGRLQGGGGVIESRQSA